MRRYLPSLIKTLSGKIALLVTVLSFLGSASRAQLVVTGGYSAAQMAAKLAGPGVTVFGATLTCPSVAYGQFKVITSNLGIDSGIVLTSGLAITSGTNYCVDGPASDFANNDNLAPGDADLTTLAGLPTNDACILEFDFKPAGDTVRFKYVFGSEEYTDFTCSSFNDVFGFLISGGAFTTPVNLAKVPGTNIPVCINSVNCGATGGYSTSTCSALGPGSPFCTYYVDNSAGTTVTYDGITTVLTAEALVSPCDTYHLKLGVADASDGAFDSGVFIEAGSLTSRPPVAINGVGLSGLPYIVRNCAPGTFVFSTPAVQDTNITVHYNILGSAVPGTDYVTLPGTVTILAGTTQTVVPLVALMVPPAGPKDVTLQILVEDPCHPGEFTVGATSTLTILDSFQFSIATPDTPICKGEFVTAVGIGDTAFSGILSYAWTPGPNISSPNTLITDLSPTVTTTYTLTLSAIAALGCPNQYQSFTITVYNRPVLTLDSNLVKTCVGIPAQLNVYASPADTAHSYTWTPATDLNSSTISNPLATPTTWGDIIYTVTVYPTAVPSCTSDTSITLRTVGGFKLPNDTAICNGAVFTAIGTGDPSLSYSWLPTEGISDPFVLNAVIHPDTTTDYVVTASFPGCPDTKDTLHVEVAPSPLSVFIGGNRFVCLYDTIHLTAVPSDPYYNGYSYAWSPATGLDNTNTATVVFSGSTSEWVYVTLTTSTQFTTTPCIAVDSAYITVNTAPGSTFVANMDFCPHDTALLLPSPSSASFHWYPSTYLSDSMSNMPVIRPVTTQSYTVVGTSAQGCKDTFSFTATVHPAAIMFMPDSVTIYPGESYHIEPVTNCNTFAWFPPAGLNADTVADPVATPDLSTKYIVNASTEWGCKVTDSIDIIVDPNPAIQVPNAFVPGSGPNGEFKIINRGIASLNYFRIFNRWGNQVFETKDINDGWDGAYKGQQQPLGVYVYEVQAVGTSGKIFTKRGNLTLIR